MTAPQESRYRHRILQPVRFGDLDIRGHLNNVALLRMLETSRVEYLVDVLAGRPEDLPAALVSLQVAFRAQAFYRDDLVCGCRVRAVGRSSITYDQQLWRASDAVVVADAEAVIVALDEAGPQRVPDPWRRRFAAWEPEPVEGLG